MLSKATIKFIHSLEQKKYRRLEGAFVVEGHKSVGDMLRAGWRPKLLLATEEWARPACLTDQSGNSNNIEVTTVTNEELQRASLLQHPSQVLAVFPIPNHFRLPKEGEDSSLFTLHSSLPTLHSSLLLCLDGVQDPGNMGTILRTADWFGITDIVCSPDTADVYNPKVVQATMGSIARVRVHYTDLPRFLRSIPKEIPIYGTLLDGDDIYSNPLTHNGIIVMGNEGNGLSQEVRQLLTHRLLIPSFAAPSAAGHAESLNVSIATAVILSEFRGRVKKT